jgi:hypothetical protein
VKFYAKSDLLKIFGNRTRGVGYVVEFITKGHKMIVEKKFEEKSVLKLAMM